MKHLSVEVPAVESGKAHAYRLRGTTADVRAAEATNGVPKLQPPYTDGQLCNLYRLTRAQLKDARKHNNDTGTRDILRDRQLTDSIDALSRVAHALAKAINVGRVTPDIAVDAVFTLDDVADELTKLRG